MPRSEWKEIGRFVRTIHHPTKTMRKKYGDTEGLPIVDYVVGRRIKDRMVGIFRVTPGGRIHNDHLELILFPDEVEHLRNLLEEADSGR